jgi:hypothetical protein
VGWSKVLYGGGRRTSTGGWQHGSARASRSASGNGETMPATLHALRPPLDQRFGAGLPTPPKSLTKGLREYWRRGCRGRSGLRSRRGCCRRANGPSPGRPFLAKRGKVMARCASQPALPQSPAFGGNTVGPLSGLFLPNTNIGQAVAQGRRRSNPAGQVGPLRPGLATIQGVQQAALKTGELQLNPVFVKKLLSLGGEKVSEVQVASGVSAPSAGHAQRRNTAGATSKRRPTTVHSSGRSTMGQSAPGQAPQMPTPMMAAPRPAGPGLGMPGLGAMKLAAPLGGAMLPPAMPKPVGQPGPTQSALAAQGPQPRGLGAGMPPGPTPPGTGGGGSPSFPGWAWSPRVTGSARSSGSSPDGGNGCCA